MRAAPSAPLLARQHAPRTGAGVSICPSTHLACPLRDDAPSQGQLRPPGGDCEPYGGFRPVFEHWLGGYLASMDSRAANPFAKDYKHLPDR